MKIHYNNSLSGNRSGTSRKREVGLMSEPLAVPASPDLTKGFTYAGN